MHTPALIPTLPGVDHRQIRLAGGVELHVATAGVDGPPALLVHGFPETWWAFRRLLPILAGCHRVVAVDLPGFGSSPFAGELNSAELAGLLGALIEELDLGPVHLLGQDISGAMTYRLAAARPDLVASYIAVETLLPGFGWEAVADFGHGGAWYIGVLATPGVADLLLAGREREFIAHHVLGPQIRVKDVPDELDLDVFATAYSGRDGFRAAGAIYRSLVGEGEQIRAIAAEPLTLPVLVVSREGGGRVPASLRNVAPGLTHVGIPGVGHYMALEAPRSLATALTDFIRKSGGRSRQR